MKQIAFDDMYCWSIFNEVRQIDFNGHLWIRDGGNVLIDPVPMSEEDLRQFDELGGARWIVITNCDHEREAAFFKERTGAEVVAHAADADAMEVAVDRTVEDGVEIVAGLRVVHLQHGKSPGELALYWARRKLLLAGDLVVGAPVGKFSLLMDEKLADPPQAALELRKLLRLNFDATLVGDGHSIMTGAREVLLQEEYCTTGSCGDWWGKHDLCMPLGMGWLLLCPLVATIAGGCSRFRLRRQLGIRGSAWSDCIVHCFCPCMAIIQEGAELDIERARRAHADATTARLQRMAMRGTQQAE